MGKGAEDPNAAPKASFTESMKASWAKTKSSVSGSFSKCTAKREKGLMEEPPKIEETPAPAKCFGC